MFYFGPTVHTLRVSLQDASPRSGGASWCRQRPPCGTSRASWRAVCRCAISRASGRHDHGGAGVPQPPDDCLAHVARPPGDEDRAAGEIGRRVTGRMQIRHREAPGWRGVGRPSSRTRRRPARSTPVGVTVS